MDKRLNFRSIGNISFLDWVAIYNDGEPICDWKAVWSSQTKTKTDAKGFMKEWEEDNVWDSQTKAKESQ